MAGPLVRLESDELEEIQRWRIVYFRELGWKLPDAEQLAESAADPHEAATLLKAGCSLELAQRILI